ncbi:protein kinase domain-containing protein [Vibrio sp. WXL210]|uniref:protein kinase family protein n=1 Tax=Vibrio sp. WXL210 TaxID=3450709 RepID=UPI003EC6DADC
MQQGLFVDSLVNRLVEKKQQQARESQLASKPSVEQLFASQFDILKVISKPNRHTKLLQLAKRVDPAQQACCKTVVDYQYVQHSDALIEEATKLEICQHPNVVKLLKLGQETRTPYLLMEWVSGESLADKIQRFAKSQGSNDQGGVGFRQDHVAWLVYQVAGALEYVHSKGICHLDVKPANILVGQDDSVKLIDFGAAQYVGQSNQVVEASLKYASKPYVETGIGTPQDDVYSLALVALTLLAGRTIDETELAKLVKSNRGPSFVEGPVWHLLLRVIESPREHGFSPITFAKEFGQFDVSAMISGAPIFTQMRNADLVLTQTSNQNLSFFGRRFWADCALFVVFVTGLFMLAHNYVIRDARWSNRFAGAPIEVTSNEMASLTPALMFTTPVWELNSYQSKHFGYSTDIEQKFKALAQAQVETQQGYYHSHQEWVNNRHKVVSSTNEALSDIRRNIKQIAELLREQDINLEGELEQSFVEVFALSQQVLEDNQRANFSLLSRTQLADALRGDQVELVADYINQVWEQQQALHYEFGFKLREELADDAYQETVTLVEQGELRQATLLASQTAQVFPESQRLRQRKEHLLRTKSERFARRASEEGMLPESVESDIVEFSAGLAFDDQAFFQRLLEQSISRRSRHVSKLAASETEQQDDDTVGQI